MAAATAAAPDMSVFIVSMPSAVLIDRPPESKTIPLPTSANDPLGAAGSVRQTDKTRWSMRAGGDRQKSAESLGADLLLVPDLGSHPNCGRLLGNQARQLLRRLVPCGGIDKIACEHLGFGDDGGCRDLAGIGTGKFDYRIGHRRASCTGRTGSRRGSAPRPLLWWPRRYRHHAGRCRFARWSRGVGRVIRRPTAGCRPTPLRRFRPRSGLDRAKRPGRSSR